MAEFVGQDSGGVERGGGFHHLNQFGVNDDDVASFSGSHGRGQNAVGADKKEFQGCEVFDGRKGESVEERPDTAKGAGVIEDPSVFGKPKNFQVESVPRGRSKEHDDCIVLWKGGVKDGKFYRKNFPPTPPGKGERKIEQMAWLQILAGFLMFFLSWTGECAQRVDAFMIELYGRKTKIISPPRYHPRTHLIIKNRTLASVTGRVENVAGKVEKYVSIRSGKTLSIQLGERAREPLFFVALSPPLQAFELRIGNPPYEIPQQR